MSEVILGMPGPWAEDNFEAADHYTTKIGGVPDWPFLKLIIKPDLLRCNSCGDNLCLVAQIYAPISSKILTVEERVIYIFACVSPTCETMSWRALRVQRSSHDKESEPLGDDSSASRLTTESRVDPWAFDFDEQNDDEAGELDLEELGRALTEATTLASASKTKKMSNFPDASDKCSPITLRKRAVGDKTVVLPCFYIYTREEKYSRDVAFVSRSNSSLMREKQSDDNEHPPEEAWEGESYEYDRALNADRTYLKFKKRLDVNPEQCFRQSLTHPHPAGWMKIEVEKRVSLVGWMIGRNGFGSEAFYFPEHVKMSRVRYSYGGKPLLATAEAGDPGRCLLCGESRHYEMQLMPPLLYYLQEATNSCSLENWNWTSVIVYTCSKGCVPSTKLESDGWVVAEEAVVVQTE